ncbi:AP2-ERF domain [Babesia duncani]|uniref:AP2-ERF domain n=1 Tax=Babesia duncani TaxID=323732 RepID=A0AAD9PP17_9APIC|nr:AP2-ERF domain [Babesia duncani]
MAMEDSDLMVDSALGDVWDVSQSLCDFDDQRAGSLVGLRRKSSHKRSPLPPPPRANATSSSGYPGVSWNKRMGAWLAFYYDNDTRRSRTFHPKYYDMDVEKAKVAAIDFMKGIEKHPRCSLRKSRKEKEGVGFDSMPYREMGSAKTRRRNSILKMKSPQAVVSGAEVYNFDSIKRNYLLNANKNMDGTFMHAAAAAASPTPESQGMDMLINNHQIDYYEKPAYRGATIWSNGHAFMSEYFNSAPNIKFGAPFFEGDVAYSSPSTRRPNPYFEQDIPGTNVYLRDYETSTPSPLVDEAEIHRHVTSIAPSSIDSFESLRHSYSHSGGPFGDGDVFGLSQAFSSNSQSGQYLTPYQMYEAGAATTFQNIVAAQEQLDARYDCS